VLDLLVAPLVAREDADAQDIGVGRVQDRQDCLHVRAARTGAVLIDVDLAAFLRLRGNGRQARARQQRPRTHGPMDP